LGNSRQYEDRYGKKKQGRGKLIGLIVAFVLTFCVGVWVGDTKMPWIRQKFGGAARAPLRGAKRIIEGADSFASKEELAGAIDSCEELSPNEKKRLKDEITKACRVKEEYDGEYKATVEQLWEDAGRIYDEGKMDGRLSASELRAVVAKLNEATEAAR
jgi:hypothetical protein